MDAKTKKRASALSAVTRVYRAHVLAALTMPLARRLCLLLPPPPSPAPCRACDGRAHILHRPGSRCADIGDIVPSPRWNENTPAVRNFLLKVSLSLPLPSAPGHGQRRGAGTDLSLDVLQGQCPRRRGSTSASLADSARSRRRNDKFVFSFVACSMLNDCGFGPGCHRLLF